MSMSMRESRRQRGYHPRWIPALVVIAFGVFFLAGNFGYDLSFFELHNWWAFFILFAALAPLSEAVRHYRRAGGVDGLVLHSLLSAAAIVMVALIFILDLSWQRWWPVFVIYGGLCMLVRGWRTRPEDDVP